MTSAIEPASFQAGMMMRTRLSAFTDDRLPVALGHDADGAAVRAVRTVRAVGAGPERARVRGPGLQLALPFPHLAQLGPDQRDLLGQRPGLVLQPGGLPA